MSTLHREIHIDNCACSLCDFYVGCRGHDVKVEFNNTSDSGSVYVDGSHAFSGGDELLQAVADTINDLWADEPKYFPKPLTEDKDNE